jgi:hypothetical protein
MTRRSEKFELFADEETEKRIKEDREALIRAAAGFELGEPPSGQ